MITNFGWTDFKPRYLRLALTCGASSQQNEIEQAQSNFYNELTAQYGQSFAANQEILKALTRSFQPILNAGINQQGFSAPELANLNAQAVEGTGQNYNAASKALAIQQGNEGGGTTYIPTGAKMQQQEELATSAAANESQIESNITAANYQTGRQNYLEAANVLGGVAGQYNPAGYASAATGAGNAASNTANEIAQENNGWMNLVSGALGAAGTAAPTIGKAAGL